MKEQFGFTLPEVLAQIVTFSLEDHEDCKGGAPEQVRWTVAFTCACFLAQHTVRGLQEGVAAWRAMDVLEITKDMPYEQRLTLAREAVLGFGGTENAATPAVARALRIRSGLPRYIVKGHASPHEESALCVGGQHSPFRVFDIDEQVTLPGEFNNQSNAQKRADKLNADDAKSSAESSPAPPRAA
ncbi:MAG: hypothetical protein EPN36_14460 [Rhodanobacteraceae bacterium]|nr:MAG: hypothetical protein EPN36_14460 [Rhodanobacteraceae bacterium]